VLSNTLCSGGVYRKAAAESLARLLL